MDAQKLGALFAERRKELNISLKDVELATSIRLHYLQAIEEGQFDQIISPIYAKGFVKQYASFLGLDGESIVREYVALFPKSLRQDFDYGIGTLETRGHPGSGVQWAPNVVLFILAFCVLGFAWFLAKSFDLF